MARNETLTLLQDVETHEPVVIASGTVRWNGHKQRYAAVAGASGRARLCGVCV